MPYIQTSPSTPLTTYVYASQLGLELNCDLMTGLNKTTGQAAADDGPAINAFLANASASNPLCLLMDGSSCTSGIFGPAGGYWSIQGFGHSTGFFQRAGTNNDVIHNGNALYGYGAGPGDPGSGPGGAAPARGANISISDIFINGNRGNGYSGNTTSGDPRQATAISGQGAPWVMGINIMNMDHVRIDNVRLYNISTYNIRLTNVGNATVTRCHFENFLPTDTVVAQNSDGLHINGPSNDITISDCYFRTGDDAIALNAAEGWSGLITRVSVVNCTAHQAQTMMRVYAGSVAATAPVATAGVDGLTVTNYQGTANVVGFIFGVEVARTMNVPNALKNISFTNCKVTAPAFALVQDNIGTLSFTDCDWIGGTRGIGMICGCTTASTVNSLSLSNCRMVRIPSGSGASSILDNQNLFNVGAPGITYNRVLVSGFQVVDTDGYSGSPIGGLVAGGVTVGRLVLAGVDSHLIAAVNNGGTIAATAGTLL